MGLRSIFLDEEIRWRVLNVTVTLAAGNDGLCERWIWSVGRVWRFGASVAFGEGDSDLFNDWHFPLGCCIELLARM